MYRSRRIIQLGEMAVSKAYESQTRDDRGTSNAKMCTTGKAARRQRGPSFQNAVCELITHVKRFSRTQALVKDFGFIADLLDKRMGCFLFQLPPSYFYSPARLNSILGHLEPFRRK